MSAPIIIGPFQLLLPIDQGGMGEVWRAVHLEQNVPVAVKVIHGRVAKDANYVEDFRNEMRAIAGLNHPGIIWIHDYGTIGEAQEKSSGGRLTVDSPYLIMEYADQGTLGSIRGSLTWSDLRSFLLALLDALGHAHARGVIHRDLKPGNVLLCGADSLRPGIKLTDFGIAHLTEMEQGQHHREQMMGTRHYMSPEQALCWWRDYGPWTDLYSVGCLVYKLATGRPPFKHRKGADVVKAQVQEAPPPLNARMIVPDGFEEWVACCLKKWPYQRFQCAADAARALIALGAAEGSENDAHDPIFRGWYVGRSNAAHVLGHEQEDHLSNMFEDSEATLVPEEERLELEMDADSWRNSDDLAIRMVKAPVVPSWRSALFEAPARKLMGVGLGLYAYRTHVMVGREAGRDRLWKHLVEVQEQGKPMAVAVNGRAGEGKTRLLQWLSWRSQELGVAKTLKVTCRKSDAPMTAILRMVESVLRLAGMDEGEKYERLERLLKCRGVEETEIKAIFRSVRHGGETPQGISWAHLDLAVGLIGILAKERPVLLWIEDAHYSASALNFLRTILREYADDGSILCVMTLRDDLLEDDSEEYGAFTRLAAAHPLDIFDLGPLSNRDRESLVRELLNLDADLAARVVERSEGNPQFAVQVVGDWVQRGLLKMGARGFTLKSGAVLDVPGQLDEVWRVRIDEMFPTKSSYSRDLLECAAVLGQEFKERIWVEVTDQLTTDTKGATEERRRLLEQLQLNRMITQTEDGWAFVHVPFRESVLRMARERGHWKQHHLACAYVIQEHVTHASDWERLGRHLLAGGVPHEAVSALGRGVKGLETGGLLRKSLALLAVYEQALEQSKRRSNHPNWEWLWGKRASLMWQLGYRRESKYWLDKAIEFARRNNWVKPLRERIALRVQWALDDGDAPMARAALEEYQVSLQEESDPKGWGDYFRLSGLHDLMLRHFESALLNLGRARSCFGTLQLDRQNNWCLVPMASVHLEWGEIAAFVREVDRMEGAFSSLGDQRGLGYVAYFRSRLARYCENVESAQAWALEANSRWQDCGAREVILGQVNVGMVRVWQGRYDMGRRRFESALSEAQYAQWKHMHCLANVGLLAALAGLEEWGGWDGTLGIVTQAVRGGRFLEWDSAWPLQLAGQLASESGKPHRARGAFELALKRWRFLGNEERANQVLGAMSRLQGGG